MFKPTNKDLTVGQPQEQYYPSALLTLYFPTAAHAPCSLQIFFQETRVLRRHLPAVSSG